MDKQDALNAVDANPLAYVQSIVQGGKASKREYRADNIDGGCKSANPAFCAQLNGHFKWYDFEMAQGGDAIALAQTALGLTFQGALQHVAMWAGIDTASPTYDREAVQRRQAQADARRQQAQADADQEKKAKLIRAEALWRDAVPLLGTPGEAYLRNTRKLPVDLLSPAEFRVMRWHPGEGAIVLKVQDALTDQFGGVHRIYVNNDGSKNGKGKKRLGSCQHPVIKFQPDTFGMLAIAEGPETALRLITEGVTPLWSTIDAGGMERFPVLPEMTALHVFADAGKAGVEAAKAVRSRYKQADIWCKAQRAPADDFDSDTLAMEGSNHG